MARLAALLTVLVYPAASFRSEAAEEATDDVSLIALKPLQRLHRAQRVLPVSPDGGPLERVRAPSMTRLSTKTWTHDCLGSCYRSTLDFEGQVRAYEVEAPNVTGLRPLLVDLHGHNSNASLEREYWRPLCQSQSIICAWPEGLDNTWRKQDVSFLQAVIDEIKDSQEVDPSRVFLTGSARGCTMASSLLLESEPGLFKAMACMSGAVDAEPSAAYLPTSVLIIAGSADNVSFSCSRASFGYLNDLNQCGGIPREVYGERLSGSSSRASVAMYPSCGQGTKTGFAVIDGGDHVSVSNETEMAWAFMSEQDGVFSYNSSTAAPPGTWKIDGDPTTQECLCLHQSLQECTEELQGDVSSNGMHADPLLSDTPIHTSFR